MPKRQDLGVTTASQLCRAELRAGKAAAKAEKAAHQPPRLGKVKFEAEAVQVCHLLNCALHVGCILHLMALLQ